MNYQTSQGNKNGGAQMVVADAYSAQPGAEGEYYPQGQKY
jgi:hypothetical protein